MRDASGESGSRYLGERDQLTEKDKQTFLRLFGESGKTVRVKFRDSPSDPSECVWDFFNERLAIGSDFDRIASVNLDQDTVFLDIESHFDVDIGEIVSFIDSRS